MRPASMIGSLALAVTDRLRGTNSRELLRKALEEEQVTLEEAERRQLERGRELVRYAMISVPWYQETYSAAGVVADDIRTWDDWRKLPILEKDDIRVHGQDLVSREVPPERLIRHHSGGSTGVPLSFFHDRDSIALSDVGAYRGFSRSGWSLGEMIGFFWGSTERIRKMSALEFEMRQQLRRWYLFDAFAAGDKTYPAWVRTLERVRPTILYGYASTLADFASYLSRRSVRIPPVKGVFTTAEKLYAPQRSLMESAFQAKVYDCYGSSEVRNIATECSSGSMHINSDYVIVEERDGRNELEGKGFSSPLLVTSLINRAMPFIRYANGDCGSLSSDVCGCGSGFPLMELDIGRTNDDIVLSDGTRFHSLALIYLFYGSRGVASFQFHQRSHSQMVLRVVPVPGEEDAMQASIETAARELHKLSKGLLELQVERVNVIDRSRAGKHRYVISDLAVQ